LIAQHAYAGAGRFNRQAKRLVSCDRARFVTRRRRRLEDAAAERVDVCRSALERPSCPQPPHDGHVEYFRAYLLRATERDGDIVVLAHCQPKERRRRDPDDFVQLPVDAQTCIARELTIAEHAPPEVVADDGARARTRRLFVGRLNQSPAPGRDSQNGEGLAAYSHAVCTVQIG
jgi:hypothetical protein